MNDYFALFMVIGVVVEIIGAIAGIAQKSARASKPRQNQELLRQQMEQDSMIANEFMQQQQMESDRFMQEMQQQQFMDFSEKSVTPFEMGGFDTSFGNSFNDFNNGGMF